MVLYVSGFVLLDVCYEEYDVWGKVFCIDSLCFGFLINVIYFDFLYGYVFVWYDYYLNGLFLKRVLKVLNGMDLLMEMWSVKGLLLIRVMSDYFVEWSDEGILLEDWDRIGNW